MKYNTRRLTKKEGIFAPEFAEIFRSRIEEIAHLDPTPETIMAIRKFSSENIQRDINDSENAYRFFGCFQEETPVGFLIEKDFSDSEEGYHLDFNHLCWMVSRESGKGIGSFLIDNCIDRSRRRDKDYVTLNVLERNTQARRLYERKGFIYSESQPDPSLGTKFMGYRLK